MKILIITAMQQERDAYLDFLNHPQNHTIQLSPTDQKNQKKYLTGQINQHDVLIIESGIGKVNAAITTALLIEKFKPDLIINSGSAGGIHQNIKIGDVVIADKLAYFDADATAFNYKMGQIPQMPEYYFPKSIDIINLKKSFNKINLHQGLICSGDSFISDLSKTQTIQNHFPDIFALDMESTAIAQSCYLFNIPFYIIRSISDHANEKASQSFDEYLKAASKNSAELVRLILAG